ncbi:hypothetical protein PGT21_020436 [Puccinia graminis f. sp. tritici]|uniref:Rho-GAP domain-containing protein n=1 Tax=Puccinia graminis f. sp. tritici TaxID=56615 RepID=A0A5B0NQY3_PUCGR|nr:hypothetical protein PGT21_020436 [Puccinia graminis f. sp. tritici]KAA1125583.1 hypothetical protein PGTUg99_021889 [Puccinia graminis f. sp. tritici]
MMFSHLTTALAKSPKLSKSNSLSSHVMMYDARPGDQLAGDSHFAPGDGEARYQARQAEYNHYHSELETLRQHHNADERPADYYSGRLRANSAQTMNSIRTSSTHTTNTNCATSPGVFQQAYEIPAKPRPDSVASQSSSIVYPPKSGTRALILPFSKSNQPKDISGSLSKERPTPPPVLHRFRTLSNASFSMRREQSLQQPHQLEAQVKQQQHQHHQQHQQQHHRAHTDQIFSEKNGHQQLEERLISRSSSASNHQDFPRKLHLPTRSTSQNHDSRPPPLVDTSPQNGRRRSSIPRPALTPLKSNNYSFSTNAPEANNTSRSTPNSRSAGAVDFSTAGHFQNNLPPERSSRDITQTLPSKRWSIVDSQQAPSVVTGARPNLAKSTNPSGRVSSTSLTAPKGRGPIKPRTPVPESRRRSIVANESQTARARPESFTNTSNFRPETPPGFKYNPTVLDGDTHTSHPPQIPVRQESPEELIQYLERLIGHDELRLLTHVDKLIHQCTHTFLEGETTKQLPQDTSHPNRRSIGNGILGRLGWKNKKGTTTPEPPSRSKSVQRREISTDDRRATFGLTAGNTARLSRYGIFGCSLEESDPFSCVTVIGGHKHLIPIVMFSLVEEIYARGMETPGFMRIAGKVEKIDALAEAFEQAPLHGEGVDLASEDIHVLCSLFKRYLRALPEPLMSRELFHIFWSFCVRQRNSPDPGHLKNTIAAAQCIMRLMPPRSFSLLIYVVAFLSQIPLFPQCKFSSTGIAKIFGPALFGSRTQRNPASDERPIQALKWVLENWNMLTDGLLNEHFTVDFANSSAPPIDSSIPAACVSESNSPVPSCQSPAEIPTVAQDVQPLVLQSPEQIPSTATLEPISVSSRKLLDWRSQSNGHLRKSNSSAQNIVDRYEAHEKSFSMVDDQVKHHKQESSDSKDRLDCSARSSAPGSPSPIIEFEGLSKINEVTTETQASSNTGDDHRQPKQTECMSMGETFRRQSQNEGEEKARPRTQVIVLNEPFQPATVAVNSIADNLPVPEYHSNNREIKAQSTISYSQTLKSLDSIEVENLITQGLQLRQVLSNEKLCDCNFVDRSRAQRMVKQSLELIKAHQDMLSEMKSQLTELLNEDGKD